AGGHVDAGAYEYRLYDGDASGAGESWFLRSTSTAPTAPTAPGISTAPAATLPTYRAEVPLYSALPSILRQGDLAMLSTLHRRVGDESTFSSNAVANTTRAWGRVIGGNTTVTQTGTTSPESRTSMGGFQTGVDLYADTNWNAGLYVGKLRSDADVRGVYGLGIGSAYAGRLRADTTYLGGYATYANANGLYVDTVLQYGIQDITGLSSNASASSADGKSLTASVEAGQRFPMGANWSLEPQAQLIYNRQNLGGNWIGGLTTVDQDTANAVIGRLGVRMTGDFTTSVGRLQPYARVNLWHGFSGTDTTSFQSPAAITNFDNRIGYTSVEVAAGATLALTPTTSIYGEVGSLAKAGGQSKVKSSVQGSVGVKLRF
ncbi:MAG: autotransporter outer membrane beta-barrel domain-containing protein, partial [Comamonadaceae bacterium]